MAPLPTLQSRGVSSFCFLFFLVTGYLALGGNFRMVLSQHCGSLDSGSLSNEDLCYPHWKQLSNDNNGRALIYLQDSQTSSKDALLLARQQSEGLKAIPKSCRNAAAALVCSGTLLGCEYTSLGQGMIQAVAHQDPTNPLFIISCLFKT